VSSANFVYGLSLSLLAFAYLGGITSINGALFGGAVFAGSVVPTFSNYFLKGTNMDRYLTVLGGFFMIVTAIVHPEGAATFFQGGMRAAGNWLTGVIPGARTLRDARQGPRRVVVNAILLVLLIGFALWIYNAQFIDSNTVWVIVSLLIFWALAVIAAVALGGINPTFAAAGRGWVGWFTKFGPAALVGYVLGWIVWPVRVDTYSKFWMPLLGAGIALFLRSLYRQIRYGRPDMHAPPPEAATEVPATAEVG